MTIFLLHFKFFPTTWPRSVVDWGAGSVLLIYWALLVPYILKNRLQIYYGLTGAVLGYLMFVNLGITVAALFAHKTSIGLTSLKEINFVILYLIILVWVADSAAYFVGKIFGQHKLALSLSPGKSVEGVIGGVLTVMVYSALYFAFLHQYLSLQAKVMSLFFFVLLSIPLSLLSVIGDLLESYLKRTAGVKDSGRLFPGHGGVYDRMDAQVAVLTLYPLYQAVLGLIGGI